MDTLYLLRFSRETPLDKLSDEQQDLYVDIKKLERQIIDLDPLESYSKVARLMRSLAVCKAKKSYIERLISRQEAQSNKANKELNQTLFPPDYYGDYPQ